MAGESSATIEANERGGTIFYEVKRRAPERKSAPYKQQTRLLAGLLFWPTQCLGQFLFDAGRLAFTLAQVIKLGAPDVTATLDLDGVDQRAVGLEYTLYPGAV